MCEGQVPHPQVVERPQDAQATVDGVAALHADQTGHLPVLEGLSDACKQSRTGWWVSGQQVCPSARDEAGVVGAGAASWVGTHLCCW